MIDTHAHLSSTDFDADRDDVVARAFAAGTHRIVEVGIEVRSSRAAVELARRHEAVSAAVGIHPHEAGRQTIDHLASLEPLLADPTVVAIGETGLDFYRDYAPHDRQEALFRRHIALALEHDLPLVVHSRGAEERVLEILEETGADRVGGVLHCYGGPVDLVPRVAALGFDLGFGGAVTRSRGRYRAMLPVVPRERMLLETDCPYLAPAPRTSRRNEPAFLVEVLPVMAGILAMDPGDLERVTDANARRRFRIADGAP